VSVGAANLGDVAGATVFRDVSFALFGLIFGSFLTVVVHRTPLKRSIVAPRSACPRCGTEIRARDNIPVASYLLLRGRCRHCQHHISAEYPVVEALTAALFVAASLLVHPTPVAALIAPFLGIMVAVALIDARHRIIPNAVMYPSLLAFAIALAAVALAGRGVSLAGAGLGLLAFGGGLLLVALVSPRGMGMGDVKLAALIGLVLGALGWRYVGAAVLLAVLAGGAGAILTLVRGGSRKDAMPFGPYLAGGAVLSALAAPQLSAWYLGLFR
jgi:leader peptidase (prepilin peptidase) / N-methyltransferase